MESWARPALRVGLAVGETGPSADRLESPAVGGLLSLLESLQGAYKFTAEVLTEFTLRYTTF